MRQTLEVDGKHKHMQNKLNYLESSIQEESDLHDQLMRQLVGVIRSREEFQVTSSASPSTQNSDSKVSNYEDKIRLNGVKEIPLLDTSIHNSNRHNLSLIKKHGNGFKGPVIPVLVFACNRVSVRNCLDNLVNYRPNAEQFPIIVSQVSNQMLSINVL